MTQGSEPIVLTGRTLVTGALEELFSGRTLARNRPQTGDLKLWCHMLQPPKQKPGQPKPRQPRVSEGLFRAAVFDGKTWRTFRLNIVVDSDGKYETFPERTTKARRIFSALSELKGQTARLHEGSYGCLFTMAPPATSTAATTGGAQAGTAARTVETPATGTQSRPTTPPPGGKKGGSREVQLTLF